MWIDLTIKELRKIAEELGREWEITAGHCEHVKWYAPHIRHIVLDVQCRSLSSISQPKAPNMTTRSTDYGIEIEDGMTKEKFWTEVVPSRQPMIINHLDLGHAGRCWTSSYLSHHEESSTLVSTHVFMNDQGQMDFVQKNFQFSTMSFSELIERCTNPTQHPPVLNKGERYYFRSIGKNPRKDRSWFHASFPRLAEELKLPDFIEESRLFSTVLRVASANVHLWTHFDVLDNLLIQLQGRKTIKLWPPSNDPYLYVTGSSSEVVDVDHPDLKKYPLYTQAKCTETTLEPGQVLYIPALWFHNVASESFSVSVNTFFRHLDIDIHDRRDLYGNRDPIPVQEADGHLQKTITSLSTLPQDYRTFYGRRLLHQLETALDTDA